MIGTVVGQYEIIKTLGEGGIARVYLVRHKRLGTLHALKLLHQRSEQMAKRLLQEGRIQARLQHPNIVAVSDVIDVDTQIGLVMEYIEGLSLADLLADGEPMKPKDAVPLFAQMLAGVSAAHRLGVLHRDLKPGNVLLRVDGKAITAKITDFGIAKVASEGALGGERLTRTGTMMGTPGYMAPEQFVDAAHVDLRADVFALGVIFYEMLSGERPYERQDLVATINATSRGDHVPLATRRPGLATGLCHAIERAMLPDPKLRYGTCDEFLTALSAAPAELEPPPLNPTLAPGTVEIDAFDRMQFTAVPSVEPDSDADQEPDRGFRAFGGRREVARAAPERRADRPLAFGKPPWYASIPAIGPFFWMIERSVLAIIAPLGALGQVGYQAVRLAIVPALIAGVLGLVLLFYRAEEIEIAQVELVGTTATLTRSLADQGVLASAYAESYPASESITRLTDAFLAAPDVARQIEAGRALLKQMQLEISTTTAAASKEDDLKRKQVERDLERLHRQFEDFDAKLAAVDRVTGSAVGQAATTVGMVRVHTGLDAAVALVEAEQAAAEADAKPTPIGAPVPVSTAPGSTAPGSAAPGEPPR